jgi:hypothetical protein
VAGPLGGGVEDLGTGPLGGGAGDPGAPKISAKKHRQWVLMKIRERPPSTLKNIDDEPPGGC